jgi:hypothetical protein
VNSLWPLFGIANQLLSVVALCLGTTILIKMKKQRHVWVTLLPLVWVAAVTFTAAVEKIWSADPLVGFLSSASGLAAKLSAGAVPPGEVASIERTVFNLRLDAAVAALFMALVGSIVAASVARWVGMLAGTSPLDLKETPPVWLPAEALVESRPRGWLRWMGGAAVLGLGLLKHLAGERAESSAPLRACSTEQRCAHDEGASWAAREERRFQNPRCC